MNLIKSRFTALQQMFAAVAIFALVLSIVFGAFPTANADAPVKIFTASVNPSSIGVGQTVSVTFTVNNSASSNQDIKSVKIVAPATFSVSNVAISAGPGSWGVDFNSPNIEASLNSGPNGIAPGDSLTITADITNVSASNSTSWNICSFINNSFQTAGGGAFDFNAANAGCGSLTITVPPTTGTITINKTVINDDGGTSTAASFTYKIDGVAKAQGVAHTVTAGSHTLSEDAFAGYTASAWGGSCAADGTITVVAGQDYTCTITNDDNEPAAPTTGEQSPSTRLL
jgi:hypothetical protein